MRVKCVNSHKARRTCVALGEHSASVSHCDVFQAWGSESSLMKFMAGKGTESRSKGKQTMKLSDAMPLPSHKPGQRFPDSEP